MVAIVSVCSFVEEGIKCQKHDLGLGIYVVGFECKKCMNIRTCL